MPLEELGKSIPDEIRTNVSPHNTWTRSLIRHLGSERITVTLGRERKIGPGERPNFSQVAELSVQQADMMRRPYGPIEVYELPEAICRLFFNQAGRMRKPLVQRGLQLIADRYTEWRVIQGPHKSETTVDGFLSKLANILATDLNKK